MSLLFAFLRNTLCECRALESEAREDRPLLNWAATSEWVNVGFMSSRVEKLRARQKWECLSDGGRCCGSRHAVVVFCWQKTTSAAIRLVFEQTHSHILVRVYEQAARRSINRDEYRLESTLHVSTEIYCSIWIFCTSSFVLFNCAYCVSAYMYSVDVHVRICTCTQFHLNCEALAVYMC